MKGKYLLCDSSSLISLTSACLDNLVYFFKDNLGVRFIIPQSVEEETVDRPLSLATKEYCFSAIRIKEMIKDGAIEVVREDVSEPTRKLMETANAVYYARGSPITLMHMGETEILALASRLEVNSILIDERTTRLFIEDPGSMALHLQDEFHTSVMVNKKNLSGFYEAVRGMDVIRSTELAYIGYEKGFFDRFNSIKKQAAEAALFRLKYSGCSISFKEISEYVGKMG